MTEQEFLNIRMPFWLEGDDLRIAMPSNVSDKNDTHAHLCKKFGYNFMYAIRGYWIPKDHVTMYTANYAIPNMTVYVLNYIFEYFKDIKYIGLGCIIGEPGEIWKPQLVIPRNANMLKDDIRGI